MADQRSGGISWTEETWNPIRGCRRVNKDCIHCYAETVAARFDFDANDGHVASQRIRPPGPYFGLITNGRWNGTIRTVPEHLTDPLRWRRPRKVFVNSMSDLFFEDLPFEEIDRIFAVMALARRHTFQVLTKRPARMLEYFRDPTTYQRVRRLVDDSDISRTWFAALTNAEQAMKRTQWYTELSPTRWPLENVWLGASMGHQKAADEFMPVLVDLAILFDQRAQRTPELVLPPLWVSAEPLIEPLTLAKGSWLRHLDWIVAGGESGDEARPCHPDWVRLLRDEALEHGVAFHFKQWGQWFPRFEGDEALGASVGPITLDGRQATLLRDPRPALLFGVGKKAAGNTLDGRGWDEYPTGRNG